MSLSFFNVKEMAAVLVPCFNHLLLTIYDMEELHYRFIQAKTILVVGEVYTFQGFSKMAESGKLYWIFRLLMVLGLAAGKETVVMVAGSSNCAFPAIYNFGDSNSDTGARSAAFIELPPPYGETTFKKPSGRFSDGRLILDLIAEKLGLPYVSAYLDSIGTDFRQGANFATAGSSIRPGGSSPFDLGVQLSQFRQFKSRTTALYKNLTDSGMISSYKSKIPKPGDFPKALYTFDIGQNDLAFEFQNMTQDQIRATFPDIMDQFAQTVVTLYNEGARAFWVHNTGPIGCLPYLAIPFMALNGTLDQYGCAKPMNDMAQEFNQQLKNTVAQLRTEFTLATFTYADIYSAKFELISNAKHIGFDEPLKFCCGTFGPPVPAFCGTQVDFNGTTYNGTACDDPSRRINWDGIHYTEAANLWIAARILNGSLSDPPIPIEQACP